MSVAKLLLILLGITCLAGCHDGDQQSSSESPITPSESGDCRSYRSQLQQKVSLASQGDAAEMYALGIFYMVCEGKDSEGEQWVERAADAGLDKAQKYMLGPLDDSKSDADHVRAKELRTKWNLPKP